MLIIPAIDLKDNNVVQLVGGVFGSEQVVINDFSSVAEKFYNSRINSLINRKSAYRKDIFFEVIE